MEFTFNGFYTLISAVIVLLLGRLRKLYLISYASIDYICTCNGGFSDRR